MQEFSICCDPWLLSCGFWFCQVHVSLSLPMITVPLLQGGVAVLRIVMPVSAVLQADGCVECPIILHTARHLRLVMCLARQGAGSASANLQCVPSAHCLLLC